MEDRYLFRGKRIDGNGWIKGNLVHHDGIVDIHCQNYDISCQSAPFFQILEPTIGLKYDGQTDCNDRPFFVGDKIKMTCLKGNLKGSVIEALIKYSCGRIHIDLGASLYDVLLKDDYRIEITGTIHDD